MTTPPSPPRAPRRRDAEATRTRLRAAALELFTTIGFRATTTALIAERAGIAEGTIYRHVSGKDELFAEVHRQAQQWAAELVRVTADPERPLPARERLQRIGRRLFEAAAREPAQLRMALGRDTDPALDDKGEEAAREFRELLLQVVATGKSDGVVRAGPAELWAALWLAVVGFGAERVAAGEWTSDHPQALLVLEAAWDAIAPQ